MLHKMDLSHPLTHDIPLGTTELDLRFNNFSALGNDQWLAEYVSKIPDTVTTLLLEGVSLYDIEHQGVLNAVRAINAPLLKLSLRANDLARLSTDELVAIFQSMPPSLTMLDLSFNMLGEKSCDDLKRIFAALGKNIRTLDLHHNFFHLLSTDQLVEVFSSLPEGLVSVELSRNYLFNARSEADCERIMAAFPSSVTHIAKQYGKFLLISRPTSASLLDRMGFGEHLGLMEGQMDQMKQRCPQGAEQAYRMVSALQKSRDDFLSAERPTQESLKKFQTECISAVEQARPMVTKNNSCFTQILLRFLSAILSIVTVGVLNCKTGRGMFGLFEKRGDLTDAPIDVGAPMELNAGVVHR